VRSKDYGPDLVAARPRRVVAAVPADHGLVVEEASTGFCGAVVEFDKERVSLEDRHGKVRVFPLDPAGFLLDGAPVTLVRPVGPVPVARTRTASGSVAVAGVRARVARGSRIWVEGKHDAQLVERVWGDDLRHEGVVVERLDGADHLGDVIAAFRPGPGRRLGVLLDHLVEGSKEARLAASVDADHVLVAGHPYVDVWQAVKPAAVGIDAWPAVPMGRPWTEGVCAALGRPDPRAFWREVLAAVDDWTDVETPLVHAVESLIDFVTAE
jgi:hypothetical protein